MRDTIQVIYESDGKEFDILGTAEHKQTAEQHLFNWCKKNRLRIGDRSDFTFGTVYDLGITQAYIVEVPVNGIHDVTRLGIIPKTPKHEHRLGLTEFRLNRTTVQPDDARLQQIFHGDVPKGGQEYYIYPAHGSYVAIVKMDDTKFIYEWGHPHDTTALRLDVAEAALYDEVFE